MKIMVLKKRFLIKRTLIKSLLKRNRAMLGRTGKRIINDKHVLEARSQRKVQSLKTVKKGEQ